MSHTGFQERDRSLLDKRSLETCPQELRQSLAYVLHLCSYWRPERRTKLVAPTQWMEFLVFDDDECGMECVANQRCPFRNVRFEDVARRRMEEELPREVVSQFLTEFGTDDRLATLVPRAFEGIPRTSPRRDIPQDSRRRINFAVVSGNARQCLLFGMKEPSRFSRPLTTGSISEELAGLGRFYLASLTSLIKGNAVGTSAACFPEWLVLFGLIYDAHHVRVVAYLPRKLDVMDCAAYVVDELSLCSGSAAGVPACTLVLERLSLLLALSALRRHLLCLSELLGPRDSAGRSGDPSLPSLLACEQQPSDSSESGSPGSSPYSTCPSSFRAHGSSGGFSSPCGSSDTFSCSTCWSLLDGTSTFESCSSEGSRHHMGPPRVSYSQGDENVNRLRESKRREIIAWARNVVPTEHPVKDTYKMAVHSGVGSRTKARVQADRQY